MVNLTLQKPSTKLDKPIFIVGSGRSGTTLLLHTLGKHKNIYFVKEETQLFVRYKTRPVIFIDKYEKEKDLEKLTLSILSQMFYGEGKADVFIEENNFQQDVIQIYNEIKKLSDYKSLKNKFEVFNYCVNYLTAKENKKRWVEKTPNNVYTTPFILSIYPSAKFIEIYRDPRSVCHSWLNAKMDFFMKSNMIECIQAWRRTISTGETLLKQIPDQYYRIRYEDLINSPEKELRKLCEFINEDFDPKMLEVHVVNNYFKDMEYENGFSKIPLERWKKSLTKNELIFIDLLTKKYRKILHYPDSGARLSIFNTISFLFFVIKISIKGRAQLINYLRFRIKMIFKSYLYRVNSL